MAEGSLDAKGAVHLRGESGVYAYPAAQVKLDSTEDDSSSGGFVWSFFFPADALRSLGPSARLEIDMHAANGSSFSFEWLNRLHEQSDVVLKIEGESRVAYSPWKGGPLPSPSPLTPHQERQQRQQQLQLKQPQDHNADDMQGVGLVKAEQEVVIDPYKPQSEPGSIRPRSVVPAQASQAESFKVAETNEEHKEDPQQHAQQKSAEDHSHVEVEEEESPLHERDIAVECAEGESWDEEAEVCRPDRSETASLWLLFVLSVLSVGGIWLISRLIMKRRGGEGKPMQRHTEFGRFDLLNMDERHASEFDDDV